jgi:LysR family hydrogen peroxide-inducible transcriptional activator
MNLRDLEYIKAVADTRSFTKAAEQCHVSQPTLSGQITKLEAWLGVNLFERNNKTVLITDVGKEIIAAASRALHETVRIKEIANAYRDPLSGTLKLGAFPTLSTYLFPRIAPAIAQALPAIHLVLHEEKTHQLLHMLRAGELDAAYLALPVATEGLEVASLFEDVFYVAVATTHPLTARTVIDYDDLAAYPLLLLEEGHCLRQQALEICTLHQLYEHQDVRATGLETIRQLVAAGMGVTLIPEIAKREGDGITYIPFISPAPSRHIGLVWRKHSPRRALMEELTSLTKQSSKK